MSQRNAGARTNSQSKWARISNEYGSLFGYNTTRGYTKGALRARKSESQRMKEKKTVALIRYEMRKAKVEKLYTITNTVQAINAAMTGSGEAYFFLNAIGKGTDDYQRDGDSIALRELRLAGQAAVQVPTTSGSQNYYLTIFVLNCKSVPQATSANLPWGSFLENNGGYQQWTGLSTDRYLKVNSDDFQVLFRKDYKVNFNAAYAAALITAGAQQGEAYVDFDIKIPFKDRHVQYEAGTNAPSTFNPFCCFAITNQLCDANTATGGLMYTNFSQQIRFVDDN